MNTVLISGGSLDEDFALAVLKKINPECIIGIDGGLDFCYKHQIVPQYILGDFDSVNPEVIKYYRKQTQIPIREFLPEKDATDTQIAMELAMKLGSDAIYLLGATGGRLDHFWGNVQLLSIPLQVNVPAYLLDQQNCMILLKEKTTIQREEQFGKYISFFSWGERVEGLTLEGFKYPLKEYLLTNSDSLGVSNEIVENTATIKFRQGIVLMVMSKDR